MSKKTGTLSLRRIRREDLFAGFLLTLFVVSLVLLASIVLIAHEFRPEGSLLGQPTRIWTCGGRSYETNHPGRPQVWTHAQVLASMTPGFVPTVFEPVIGQIPLFAPFAGPHDIFGERVCDTLVFLHVGPDAYLVFALEGGP